MKKLTEHSSPLPWSIEKRDGGSGWTIVDANDSPVCDLWFNEGQGVENFDNHQINAILIVELVNSAGRT